MKRSPMKRGKPLARKSAKKRVMPKREVARSAVRKGPARDKEHLAKVREEFCLICDATGQEPEKAPRSQAHHVRSIGPRTMGKRVSDYLAAPLCPWHHRRLHQYGEASYWEDAMVDPAAWIAAFSEEGRKEIERIGGVERRT